jgi:hypothetical protein
MSRFFAFVLALCLVVACAQADPSPPVVNPSYAAFTQSAIAIHQGVWTQDDTVFACHHSSPSCSVQTEFMSMQMYTDADNNRTCGAVGSQRIVTLYGPNGDNGGEYLTDSNGTCQSYCPLQPGTYFQAWTIGPDPEYKGSVNTNGQTYDEWYAVEDMGKTKVQLQTFDTLVDSNGLPYQQGSEVTPFNQDLFTVVENYSGWVAGTPDASWFVVNGMDNCPLDSSCQSSPDRQILKGAPAAFVNKLRLHAFAARQGKNVEN